MRKKGNGIEEPQCKLSQSFPGRRGKKELPCEYSKSVKDGERFTQGTCYRSLFGTQITPSPYTNSSTPILAGGGGILSQAPPFCNWGESEWDLPNFKNLIYALGLPPSPKQEDRTWGWGNRESRRRLSNDGHPALLTTGPINLEVVCEGDSLQVKPII